MRSLVVYCDGACEPKNPGGWGVGGWVVKDDAGNVVAKGARDLGCYPELTNNIAEYGAVRAVLDFLVANGWTSVPVVVRTDSQLVVRQLNDEWRAKAETLRRLRDEIWALLDLFTFDVVFEWVPREQNTEADDMSRSLYRADRMNGGPRDEIHVPFFVGGAPNVEGLSSLEPLNWLKGK